MIQAQIWLNKKYLSKKETALLFARSSDLEGELIIQDFTNLETILSEYNKGLRSISLINLPNLTTFNANGCQLTNLEINNCPNLTNLNVGNNLLTDTSFIDNLNPQKLNYLSVHSNNFIKQDLSCFGSLVNLEELYIDNHDKEKFEQGTYNRFHGSLEILHGLINLKILNLTGTEVSPSLEYLSDSVEKIYYDNNENPCPESLNNLERQMGMHNSKDRVGNYCDYQSWRKTNYHLVEKGDLRRAENWLRIHYPQEKRKKVTELKIDNRRLGWKLNLNDFTNLKRLDCSNDQPPGLELELSLNKTLQSLPNPKKLEYLNLSGNKGIKVQNLEILTPFTELRELHIEDCPFTGSLTPLKNLTKLERIYLSGTDIDSGLIDLPNSCQKLVCNFDYRTDKRSIEIIKELGRYLEEGSPDSDIKHYYNLVRWKEDKRNNIALSIETDKLYSIRSEIENFYSEWDKERLNKLENQDQINVIKSWTNDFVQWTNRIASVCGGGLLLAGTNQNNDYYTQTGGVIAIASPFVEVVTSSYKEKLHRDDEIRWEEFIKDAKRLWNIYRELLHTLPNEIPVYPGKVNDALKNLKEEVDIFFQKYDKNKDRKIDEDELEEAKREFPQDLRDNWEERKDDLKKIAKSIKVLEKEVKNYRNRFFFGVKDKAQNTSQLEVLENEEYHAQQEVAVDLDKYFNK